MSHNKIVLLIGGPADGTRIVLSASARIYNACVRGLPDNEDDATSGAIDPSRDHMAEITTYAIGAVQNASHDVFHIGVVDHNTCVLCELVAGYRKPRSHSTDANVAKQLVTFLGGAADGHQAPVQTGLTRCKASFEGYDIVPLICRDGTEIRVGVTDRLRADPIRMLIEGYRMGAQA